MTADILASLRLSDNDLWATPQHVFDALDEEFHFTLDVCADDDNHKCENYYNVNQDGLTREWTGVCWMNPPYGKTIGKWVRKAAESAEAGAVVVGLLPNRTDTNWWQDVMRASEIRFVKGRLKFGDADYGAPFGSVIAVWGGDRVPTVSVVEYHEGERAAPRTKKLPAPQSPQRGLDMFMGEPE